MNREKILIVDDEEYILKLLKLALQRLGYECETVNDGYACLSKFDDGQTFDIVLLDIAMPKLDGIETLKKLKQISPDLSVVMVSASKDAENVKAAMQQGAYDYIFKPFDMAEVETVIQRAAERTELIKKNRDYQFNLEQRVQEQTEELLNLYSDTLQAMILALDLREKETGFHSYRVTEYALTLGQKMELSEPQLSGIAKGALLHDIGKIGVPDSILLKPGELDHDEWRIMKKHPRYGYELVKEIQFLEDARDLVLCHHERYDGGGYPHGIKGSNIPIEARIFSIVDTMDALTSDRLYRSGIPFDEARNKIEKESGAQFDPDILNVFLDITDDEWQNIMHATESSGTTYLKSLFFKLIK
ncbi:MAG: response regulator [Candidatus Dadabacteria bacterium]|nr:response regulator [Candidatus Dadabacteria bacterium]